MSSHDFDELCGAASFRRGDPGYEPARRATMWNARLPARYPELIVQAQDVYQVVAAVKLAKRRGYQVGVRSGGHSWAGNHVREGGLLLDVSRLNEVRIDKQRLRATTGPGRAGHELSILLGDQGLFFPGGHCKGVCVGGYLLQGGFGWHSRTLGMACESVEAIDLVTADGELCHASPSENADLYWAARGAGPGFFGVVTRFHLRVYRRPKVIGFGLQIFPLALLEDVYRWAAAVGPQVSRAVEFQLLMTRRAGVVWGPGIEVFAPVFADSLGEARQALDFLRQSPLHKRARVSLPFIPATMRLLYELSPLHYPDNHRWGVDNMWTRAPIEALLPGLRKMAETLPPPPSHMLFLSWSPPAQRPEMAFSVEDQTYIALYGGWRDAADDGRYASWAEDRLAELAPLASGCQLADENLGRRPQRFVTTENLARLDQIRADRDPGGRFYPWMGRP
jgi:FAD/FMN-containing dehydrogenase